MDAGDRDYKERVPFTIVAHTLDTGTNVYRSRNRSNLSIMKRGEIDRSRRFSRKMECDKGYELQQI